MGKRAPTTTPTQASRENPRNFGPVTVKPNDMQRITLGRHREADIEPRFTIQYNFDVENIWYTSRPRSVAALSTYCRTSSRTLERYSKPFSEFAGQFPFAG